MYFFKWISYPQIPDDDMSCKEDAEEGQDSKITVQKRQCHQRVNKMKMFARGKEPTIQPCVRTSFFIVALNPYPVPVTDFPET